MARKPLIQPWTEEDGALLAKLLRSGKDYKLIARHMKRSAAAVRRHARLAQSKQQPSGAADPSSQSLR